MHRVKSGSALDLSNISSKDQVDNECQVYNTSKLRRVLTAHVRRKNSKKRASQKSFTIKSMLKEPLRVVHSVPLNFESGR